MSRFVSAGSIDAVTGAATEQAPIPPGSSADSGADTSGGLPKDAKWAAAHAQLEADRRRRDAARGAAAVGGLGGEKSLYDILQANKAAKQAAFEEAHAIRNQFRALDDDEIDFLDGVRASQRAEEERVRRETEERLQAFRAAQKEGGKVGEDGNGSDDVAFVAGRKRPRERGRDSIKGVKRRAGESDVGLAPNELDGKELEDVETAKERVAKRERAGSQEELPDTTKPGLVDYGSDDGSD